MGREPTDAHERALNPAARARERARSAGYVVGGDVWGVLLGGVDTVDFGVLDDVGGLPTVVGVLLDGGGGAVAPTVLGGAVVG
jgi:hypothetical protein